MSEKRAREQPSVNTDSVNKQTQKPVNKLKAVNKVVNKHENNYTPFAWHPEIDQSRFEGHGRGVAVDGYVLVSLGIVPDGQIECGVVTEQNWRARLDQSCLHDGQRLSGWSCKECLV